MHLTDEPSGTAHTVQCTTVSLAVTAGPYSSMHHCPDIALPWRPYADAPLSLEAHVDAPTLRTSVHQLHDVTHTILSAYSASLSTRWISHIPNCKHQFSGTFGILVQITSAKLFFSGVTCAIAGLLPVRQWCIELYGPAVTASETVVH